MLLNEDTDAVNDTTFKRMGNSFQDSISHGTKGNLIYRSTFGKGYRKNATTLTREVQRAISDTLATITTLEDIADIVRQNSIVVDEDITVCGSGRKLADDVIHHINGNEVHELKHKLLPLQEHWVQWSKLQKKEKRAVGKGEEQTAHEQSVQFQEEMAGVRQQQLTLCRNSSEFILSFIKSLTHCYNEGTPTKSMPFFLKWLKCHLDELSRKNLPELQKNYQEKWKEFQAVRNTNDASKQQHELKKADMTDSEKKLADASFGLEHLFREVGQMFEAVMENKAQLEEAIQAQIDKLPDIVAHLLLAGHPFELMDGDASNIPTTWIKAIFGSLEKIVGKRKVYVMSVLGVQSSGKSTLLNTMFGVQFAVSAGRCTRGVYMQIVRVDKDQCSLPFDYVLVIDTEGLRAPELGLQKFDHDNEIATFVIGLGDVTVMNVKGENYAEMKDVLQIAVHAFLRMKRVSSYKDSHHRCLFVHQNVPAVNAKEKLRHSSQKLQDILDAMTAEAAEQEQIVHIKSFNQIIDFDCQTHVTYFSDLWHGDPPMAHVNKGYTRKVQDIKRRMLFDHSKNQKTFLSMMDIYQRISDLWRGILADDFVFSFRNCLELKAYSAIERRLYELNWGIEKKITMWIKSTAEPRIGSCDSDTASQQACHDLIQEANEMIDGLVGDGEVTLKEFCADNFYHDMLVHWEQTKIVSFKNTAEDFRNRTHSDLRTASKRQTLELLDIDNYLKHQNEIMDKAIESARTLNERNDDLNTLETHFQNMWEEWNGQENDLNVPNKDANVNKKMESVIRNHFRGQLPVVKQELELNPICNPAGRQDKLVNSWTVDDIPTEFLSVKTKLSSYLPGGNKYEDYRYLALEVCNDVFEEVEKYLLTKCKNENQFQPVYMHNILDITDSKIYPQHPATKNSFFTFTTNMAVRIAVKIAKFAYPIFNEIQNKYIERHGFAAKIEKYREKTWNLFKNTVEKREKEIVAADLVCDTLKERIASVVAKVVAETNINIGVREFGTKEQLIYSVLDDLATKDCFDNYKSYLKHPLQYVKKWMEGYMERLLFVKNEEGLTKYGQLAAAEVHRLQKGIIDCIKKTVVNSKSVDMESWVNEFCEHAKRFIPIPSFHLHLVTKTKVTDYDNFRNRIITVLEDAGKKITNNFSHVTMATADWGDTNVFETIVNKLWGCEANCPFCKETCQRSDKNHESQDINHTCLQHRPDGIGGMHWSGSKKLSIQTCNFSVQSGDTFKCTTRTCITHEECVRDNENGPKDERIYHSFRDYKKHAPKWDIVPSTEMESSKYWLWVFNKYNKELAASKSCQPADIPRSWGRVTKREATESLRSIYGSTQSLYPSD